MAGLGDIPGCDIGGMPTIGDCPGILGGIPGCDIGCDIGGIPPICGGCCPGICGGIPGLGGIPGIDWPGIPVDITGAIPGAEIGVGPGWPGRGGPIFICWN